MRPRRRVDPARVFERIAAARVCVAAGGRLRFLGACTSVHVCVRSRSAHAVYHYLCVPCASRTVFTRHSQCARRNGRRARVALGLFWLKANGKEFACALCLQARKHCLCVRVD